jgi:hypothetical protein
MCKGCNQREFLGKIKDVKFIDKNEELPLKLTIGYKILLNTDTPVTVGTERLESKGDAVCEAEGIYPYLDEQVLNIVFDDTTNTKSLIVERTVLVPNPNYVECTCNCQ